MLAVAASRSEGPRRSFGRPQPGPFQPPLVLAGAAEKSDRSEGLATMWKTPRNLAFLVGVVALVGIAGTLGFQLGRQIVVYVESQPPTQLRP
jgi:hypothetical protein